ncbi:MAG TPA: cytochrome P460 family protein [Burkholderiales bacterium]|nr:cytochrome P460 family protein [Burkholderiales bacterium]
MKTVVGILAILAGIPAAFAADVEARKATAAAVCAACHGTNGASVNDTIPNLAAQRARYLEAQLKMFKDGTRKQQNANSPTAIMNAIAMQLSAEDIANLAAHFAAQPGATGTAKSELLPEFAKTRVTFPEGYKTSFTKYATINFPDRKQVRYHYANAVALQAAKAGKPLPDGSVLFVEVYSTKLDADNKPLMGSDGFLVADRIAYYGAKARQAGWGKDFPDMLRNEDWNYAIFTPQKQHRAGVNQAECLACHKPLDKVSYTFTLKQLAEVARGN